MLDALTRTDEHRLLAETAARLFASKDNMASKVVEAGLLALPFAERDGGLRPDDSIDGTDLAVVFAAKGYAYAEETTLPQAALGGTILAASAVGAALLPKVIEGRVRIATGLHEVGTRCDLLSCATRAERIDGGWELNGVKTLALGGDTATHCLILAQTAEGAGVPAQGTAFFFLDRATPGLEIKAYTLRDRTPAADLHMASLRVSDDALLLGTNQASEALERANTLFRLCLTAEAAGLMQAAVDGTVRYTAEREQFGKPVGSFQVVQHKLSDMAVSADQAIALTARAAHDTTDAAAIILAHRAVAEFGMTTLKAAIQLHGGYGMTEDLPYGQALRRMMVIGALA